MSEFQNDVFNELNELFPEFKEKHQKLQVCLKVRQIRYKFVKFGLNLQSLKNVFKFVLNSINLKLSNKCIFLFFYYYTCQFLNYILEKFIFKDATNIKFNSF